jgi:hypothetical protein
MDCNGRLTISYLSNKHVKVQEVGLTIKQPEKHDGWSFFRWWEKRSKATRQSTYIYYNSKLLPLVVWFAELVLTGLWVVKGIATCNVSWISAQTSWEGIKCTKAKEVFLSYTYTVQQGLKQTLHVQRTSGSTAARSAWDKWYVNSST